MDDADRLRVAEIMLDKTLDETAAGAPLLGAAAQWAVIAMAYRSRLSLFAGACEERVDAGGDIFRG